ncbi:hypothetical protein FACS1894176_10570 [Bacteroidia bacterium]|nr:hypothetical protein FACS1894176_10570 [Bacteroidia bacterium]
MTARCYDAIINPQPRTIESLEPADNSPSQEGMINNPNKPEFTAGDLLKEKSKGKEIVEKWEMAEQYIDDLEHHYKISEELKSQIYALYESEQKKYNPTENTDDLPL